MSVLAIDTAEVFEPLLADGARYLGAHGGRGSAKSQFFAGLAVERSVAAPTDIVCVRAVQRSLKFSIKREVENAIVRYNAGDYFEVLDRQVNSRSAIGGKGVMIFEGLQNHTAASIKSLSDFDVALCDEAQDIEDEPLKILRPTLRKPGSQLWFGWNPYKPDTPIDAFFRGEHKHPRAVCVEANWRDNPWFPSELEEERAHDQRALTPEAYAWIWEGAYLKLGEAAVFRNWRVEEFDTPKDAIFRQGADWGFSIDPSVLVRCFLVGRTLYICDEVYRVGVEIDELPDFFRGVGAAEAWPTVADSSRPETISYMQRHGFPKMRAAIKGPGSVEDGVQWLQSLNVVIHKRCTYTQREFATYAYKLDPVTKKPLPVLDDKNNHVIDAVRYACEDARRAQNAAPPITPESVMPQSRAKPMANHR